MNREELHQAVDASTLNKMSQMLVHAMIDLGRVTSFDCQVEDCIRPSRAIDLMARHRAEGSAHKDALQIDHIIPTFEGGSNRVENIRIVHYSCNCSRTYKGKQRSEEWRERVTAARRANGVESLTCPKCGRVYKGTIGLKAHNRKIPDCDVRQSKNTGARRVQLERVSP